MENKSDFVIIGGVACGPKTAAVLARRLSGKKITLFQKESRVSYGTCGMPYFASGDISSFEELNVTSYGVVRDENFFRQSKGFEVHTGHEVVAINRQQKTVTVKRLADSETFEHGYDKLVIATGAVTNKPPFPVPESDRVRGFTRPDDAVNFRKLAQQGQVEKAVIIGGGFIGCELAEACAGLWGIETTLIEKENQILPYVLDKEMSRLVEREMARNDVTVMTGKTVEKVEINDEGNPVVSVTGSDAITVDYVFLCLGVHPESDLARKADLKIGDTGGIVVNEHMQTLDENIYAGGDCVEQTHRLTGQPVFLPLGSIANRHGRVIGENLAGKKAAFPGVVGSFYVKVFDINAGSTGLSITAAEKAGLQAESVWGVFPDKPDYYPESKTFTLKLVYRPDTGQVLGLQAVGAGDICRRVDVTAVMLQNKATLRDLLDFEPGYAPPYAEALDPLYHLAGIAEARQKGIKFLDPGQIMDDIAPSLKDSLWLDVREKEEFEGEPWFEQEPPVKLINIPLNELRGRLGELNPAEPVLLLCKRGPRSYQASIILNQAGFKDVLIVSGGYQAARQ